MIIGYARVSTQDQNLDLQLQELKKYGCERIFQESVSTRKRSKRIELDKCLDMLRSGDTFVVWKFDRLERGMVELIVLLRELEQRGISVVSITQNIDTSTAMGRANLGFLAVLAETERELIRERTLAGLAVARENGRKGGRRFAVSEKDQKMIKSLMNDPTQSPTEIAKHYGISRATVYKIANGTYLQGRKAKDMQAEPIIPKQKGRPKKEKDVGDLVLTPPD